MSLPSEQIWLVLNKLITDLNKKGIKIPEDINPEMGLIKSSISFYKKNPTHMDMINSLAKADMSLSNVQEKLLTIAEEQGEDYLNEWLELLKKATRGEEVFKMPDISSKFIVNTPPGMSTSRINLRKPLAEERVQEIAEWNGVIIEFDEDTKIALYGDKTDVQHGIKEFGPFFKEE